MVLCQDNVVESIELIYSLALETKNKRRLLGSNSTESTTVRVTKEKRKLVYINLYINIFAGSAVPNL